MIFYIKCNICDCISLILVVRRMYEKEVATPIKPPPKGPKETSQLISISSHLISSHVSERDGVLPSLQNNRLFPAMDNHDSNFSMLTCHTPTHTLTHSHTPQTHTLLEKTLHLIIFILTFCNTNQFHLKRTYYYSPYSFPHKPL